MKRLNIVTLLFIICASIAFVSCISRGGFSTIKGNGNLVATEIAVSEFERINSGGSAEVRFHLSQEHRVVLTTDSNLIEYVEIITRNNSLNIGTKRGYSLSFTKWVVDVYSPTLTGISISGSGRFNSAEKITVPTFTSNLSGSGRIEVVLESETFSANISGSGRIVVTGNSNNSNIVISGSGRFNGTDFAVNYATVRISGSGNAGIWVTDNLSANVSGSGSIYYRGNPPTVNSSVSGSGRVNKL